MCTTSPGVVVPEMNVSFRLNAALRNGDEIRLKAPPGARLRHQKKSNKLDTTYISTPEFSKETNRWFLGLEFIFTALLFLFRDKQSTKFESTIKQWETVGMSRIWLGQRWWMPWLRVVSCQGSWAELTSLKGWKWTRMRFLPKRGRFPGKLDSVCP